MFKILLKTINLCFWLFVLNNGHGDKSIVRQAGKIDMSLFFLFFLKQYIFNYTSLMS